mgnify:CR=1 FL=1
MVNTVPSGSGGGVEELGFEVDMPDGSFVPEFYPEDLTQEKKTKLNRYGSGCDGESVSTDKTKNKEIHIRGIILKDSIPQFHKLVDETNPVDVISPLFSDGGLQCRVKKGKLGNVSGWDPISEQWMFEYSLDFVSTGKDEYGETENAIVTSLLDGEAGEDSEN